MTAWENLLDSVSHIGPLTNNPAEAKRLQVIRRDQSTPLAQMLLPRIKQNNTSHLKNNNKKKIQKENKTSKKKNRKQNINRTKNGKKKNANDVSQTVNISHVQKVSSAEMQKQKVKIYEYYFSLLTFQILFRALIALR